jgi:hypothetical protein
MPTVPHWTHLVFEFGIFALFVVCFRQAWNSGRRYWFMLIGAVAFGLIAEALGASPRTAGGEFEGFGRLFLVAFKGDKPVDFGYCYGDFVFKIFNGAIPVCIGVGWAVILYTAHRTVIRLGALPVGFRPLLAASLALTLDLIMDPVASNLIPSCDVLNHHLPQSGDPIDFGRGLGMWYWVDLQGTGKFHIFDVPLPNFMGWFLVIYLSTRLSISVWSRAIAWRWVDPTMKPQTGPWWKDAVVVAAIVVMALALCWFSVNVFHWVYRKHEVYAATFVVFFLILPGPLAFAYYVPVLRRNWPVDRPSLLVAFSFQIFFLACFAIYRQDRQYPYMLYAAPVIFAVSAVLYVWPYRHTLFGPPRPDTTRDPLETGPSRVVIDELAG